ncbi:MAG: STAS domain-containing protein [Chitinispirillaceae bacterium]|nr:STAS domain-containing protein [Chitinispirillaceae bacterium]
MTGGRTKFPDITLEKRDDNCLVIKVRGSIIDDNVKKLQERLERAYGKKVLQIILDVGGIDFVNSQGLGVIIYMHTLMQKSGRQFFILNPNSGPSAYIEELFRTTNLDKVLNIIQVKKT